MADTQKRSEELEDKTVADTFPASDAPARSGVTGAETPDKASDDRSIEEQPTGVPTSDRHATETAHHWEHETKPTQDNK